jgi:hypothetical protein
MDDRVRIDGLAFLLSRAKTNLASCILRSAVKAVPKSLDYSLHLYFPRRRKNDLQ